MKISSLMGRGLMGCALLLLGACGTKYSIVGNFDGSGEPLYGEIDLGSNMNTLGLGGMESGVMRFALNGGKVICEGETDMVRSQSAYTSIGMQRRSVLACNDGRKFKVETVQTSKNGGHGQGISSTGEVIRFYYDLSPNLAQSRMNVQRINTMVK